MTIQNDRICFVLAATHHGPMLVNRMDFMRVEGGIIGVGGVMLETGAHDEHDIVPLMEILAQRRQINGDGVIMIDGGANIGALTIPLGRFMTGWGAIMAFEPQERIAYALGGNIILNNCFNCRALQVVLGREHTEVDIPILDHQQPANFGGLAMNGNCQPGQPLERSISVKVIPLDLLNLPRLDLLKLDVEGMEPDVIDGAKETIARCKPVIFAEWIACGVDAIKDRLPDYEFTQAGRMNILGIHKEDKVQRMDWWPANG